MDGMYFLCNNGTQIAGRVTTCLLKNKTEKNTRIFEKVLRFIHLWNEFLIVNAVLLVPRRKKLRNASLTSICFLCCRLNFYRSAVNSKHPLLLRKSPVCPPEMMVDRCTVNLDQ